MSYLNGLPHCRWNPYVDCTHGKPKDMRIPDWIPHKKCSKCGWNPEVSEYRERRARLIRLRIQNDPHPRRFCPMTPLIKCSHGKCGYQKVSDWTPHAKCSKCGWNPDVEKERKEKTEYVRGI